MQGLRRILEKIASIVEDCGNGEMGGGTIIAGGSRCYRTPEITAILSTTGETATSGGEWVCH